MSGTGEDGLSVIDVEALERGLTETGALDDEITEFDMESLAAFASDEDPDVAAGAVALAGHRMDLSGALEVMEAGSRHADGLVRRRVAEAFARLPLLDGTNPAPVEAFYAERARVRMAGEILGRLSVDPVAETAWYATQAQGLVSSTG